MMTTNSIAVQWHKASKNRMIKRVFIKIIELNLGLET